MPLANRCGRGPSGGGVLVSSAWVPAFAGMTALPLRQVGQRINGLAVVANLEMQHVARSPSPPHLGDLLPGLHQLPFVHQARTIVPIRRQPRIVVLHDDQLTVADEPRTRIHDDAIAGSTDRRTTRTPDIDALLRRLT